MSITVASSNATEMKKASETLLIYFFVDGEPRPKQSFRVSGRGGYQPARVKAWQTDVALRQSVLCVR